jgi:thiol-disulfide isomerase/thioredoxin
MNAKSGMKGASRRSVMVGAALAAVVAGAGVSWWRLRPADVAAGAEEALWGMQFDQPAGGSLAMASLRGKPLLVNFWATWCPPCIEEMPLLDRFFSETEANGWQVIGLDVDQLNAVNTFLARQPVRFPIGMAGAGGTGIARSLGNVAGGLPFTIVFGADGRVAQRKMGKVTEADLAAWRQIR